MNHVVARVAVLVAALVVAVALPTTASAAAPGPPQVRCTLSDPRLAETSGLAWSPDGLLAVNDSGNPSTVYRLDDRCAVVGSRAVATPGRDVEDLARTADGTLWLADTGDNGRNRATVAVIRLPPQGGEQITRLTYPDGPHDAETLVMAADRRPVIVTKDLGGRSGVYDTVAPLPGDDAGPVPLRRVGTATVPPTTTRGGPSPLGTGLYTGGALSVDGRVVALRTYTDAWLYPVATPNTADAVVAALGGVPTKVPLPDEPQGEAATLTPDGTLLAAGESPNGIRASVRAVPGATALVTEAPPPGPAASGPAASGPAPTSRTPSSPGASGVPVWIPLLVGAVVVLVVVVVAALRVRSRRRAARGRRP